MATPDFSTYLTHSDEDGCWQMVCTSVGKNVIKPGIAYPPGRDAHPEAFRSVSEGRVLAEYQLVYIPEGEGWLEMQGLRQRITGGSLFLLCPGVSHAYRPDSATGWTELWAGFAGAHPDALRHAGLLSQTLFQPGFRADMLHQFDEIFQLVREQAPLYQFRACALIMVLLADILSTARRSEQQDASGRVVEQVKAYFETHIDGNPDIGTMAVHVGLSERAIGRIFRSYTGMTPLQYLLHIKINKAKSLLFEAEMSVKETALLLGFDDPYYFSRLFKRKTGVSPSVWAANVGQAGEAQQRDAAFELPTGKQRLR